MAARGRKGALSKVAALCSFVSAAVLLISVAASGQPNPDLQTYFRQNIGLNDNEIASIQDGQPVTKALPSRSPAEVFLFGAVSIHAAPKSYKKFAHDYNRMRKLPNYLALGVISNSPVFLTLRLLHSTVTRLRP